MVINSGRLLGNWYSDELGYLLKTKSYFMKRAITLLSIFIFVLSTLALGQSESPFTRADTLRGSITPERAWWDVTFYDLNVAIHPEDSTINGWNSITYEVIKEAKDMQIDLQPPLQIDSVKQDGDILEYQRNGNAYFVKLKAQQPLGAHKSISVYYSGKPQVAENPPWEGGFTWERDDEGNPWIVTTCQGLGASIWWPNKDHQTAEPDSMGINITVPDPLVNVSNGRLRNTTNHSNGTTTYSWFVNNPINNYNVAVNAGNYSHFNRTFEGENGELDVDYWVLEYNLEKAKNYLTTEVDNTLESFEYWFGPYPFYEDSYQIVDVPHTGMEHQSAIAYGNQYAPGYRGNSSSEWGLKFDFIVVHETAHEWWGNNITTEDIADMWVHEGFGSYAGSLFVEYMFGTEAGAEHVISSRQGIDNERPIISRYNVNEKPPGDMYAKGANMLHTIRQVVDNDTRWRQILRGLNEEFRHQIVTSSQVENYISQKSGKDLSKVFDQYLRHTHIPVFEYYIDIGTDTLYYRWKADVKGFDMPVKVTLDDDGYTFVNPIAGEWKEVSLNIDNPEDFQIDNNFYVNDRYVIKN
jgi:aminopeptidase N